MRDILRGQDRPPLRQVRVRSPKGRQGSILHSYWPNLPRTRQALRRVYQLPVRDFQLPDHGHVQRPTSRTLCILHILGAQRDVCGLHQEFDGEEARPIPSGNLGDRED